MEFEQCLSLEAVAAAGFEPATKGFFSSRCETILENQEKVNRDMVTSLDTTGT